MKTIKGSTLILTVLAVAIALAGFNVWYQRFLTHRTQLLWGNEVSILIAAAPHAQLLRLGPAAQAPEDDVNTVSIGGVSWPIVDSRVMASDIPPMGSPGFSNLRHSLRQDASYVWDERAESDAPLWRYALRFSDKSKQGKQSAAVLFFSDCGRIGRTDGKSGGQLIARIADGLLKFAEQKFAEAN